MKRRPVSHPNQVTIELSPAARLDVIDVRNAVASVNDDLLHDYARCFYCSFHTTAGYLEQSFAARLKRRDQALDSYIAMLRTLFPHGAGYRHDDLAQRTELSSAQRAIEPRNADSHLAFIAGGLRTAVSYSNGFKGPVWFIDLDGMYEGRARRRLTSVVGYNEEIDVAHVSLTVPVSAHTVDSVNLRDRRLGLYEQLTELIGRYGIKKGRIRIQLAPSERHAGLTVNEYETLLMRHDLREVLRDPLRFFAEKSRHLWADPRAIPQKTLSYAKYDLVRTFNQFFEAFGLDESLVERVLARAIAVPAARFLQMKRSVSLLVSDGGEGGERGAIVEGTYQSPILVQWRRADKRARRVDVTLSQFV